MTPAIKRIGVLTGGGDAPGLNAVIRAVVKSAANAGIECVGLEDSFDGLIYPERSRVLTPARRNRHPAAWRHDPRHHQPRQSLRLSRSDAESGSEDYSDRCIENFRALGLDALVVIGGDGTLAIAHEFHKRGLPIVGVPKTIDNDIVETTMTFGFDSAVAFATDAIDRLHTTAEAHHRVMVVEVMGRYAGWIALYAGIAGGADVVLIPEIPFALDKVATRIMDARALGRALQHRRRRRGRPRRRRRPLSCDGGRRSDRAARRAWRAGRPGARGTDRERNAVRRAGPPAARRVAVELTTACSRRASGVLPWTSSCGASSACMVALRSPDIVAVPLERVVGRQRTVPTGSDVIQTARNVGISFGN